MEKKQSSVEWLEQQLNAILKQCNIEIENVIWQQAKAMHKEEILDTWCDCTMSIIKWNTTTGNQYYNQTFEK